METRVQRLQLFGGLTLSGGRAGSASALGSRPLALLALMAIAGERGVRREKLIALLWPESDEDRGRNSLSQALTALRRELGADAIAAGTTELRLDARVIASDVQDFEAAVASGALERAAQLYAGPFLDGVHLRGAHAFEEWAEEQRRRLHRLQAGVLERIAQTTEQRGDAVNAVAWWQRLAALEPTSARAALGLMRALAATGERAAALQHYRVYETLLRESVGARPDATVTAFAAQMRHASGRPAPTNVPSAAIADASLSDTTARHIVDADVTSVVGNSVPEVTPATTRAQPGRALAVKWRIALAMATVAAVAIMAARGDREAPASGRRVAVIPLHNLTGDSTLDVIGFLAAQHIVDGLQRSALIQVADPLGATFGTGDLRDTADRADDPAAIERAAEAADADLLLTGTYSFERDTVVITTRLFDRARGTLVGVALPVRFAIGASAPALDRARERALGMLAVHLERSLDDLLPVGSSSAPTLAAYAEYLEGLRRFQLGEEAESVPFFERAYEMDSTFVAPLVWQAFAYGTRGEAGARRREVIRELGRHRDRLTPLDRQALRYFEAGVHRDVAGMIAALQRASVLAPGSLWSYNLGFLLHMSGRNEEAVAAFDLIDRQHGWLRHWLPFWRRYVGALHWVDHERELQTVREARATMTAFAPDAWSSYIALLRDEALALAALGRRDEVRRLLLEVESHPDPSRAVGSILAEIAEELWSRGDTTESRRVLERSLARLRSQSVSDVPRPAIQLGNAWAFYAGGHWREAQAIAQRVAGLDLPPRLFSQGKVARPVKYNGPDPWQPVVLAALSAARQGDRAGAAEAFAFVEALPDTVRVDHRAVDGVLVDLARLAAVMGERDRAVAYIRQRNELAGGRLSRHFHHRDFESLAAYAPWERVTSPAR